jgi:hypothetical protein
VYNGLGEISGIDGVARNGLRLATFNIGLYDFPSAAGDRNRDSYTTLRVLLYLESAGRTWSKIYADTYPLEVNPRYHDVTNGRQGKGGRV